MKVAYFAESPADESALKILTEAIVGARTESVLHNGLRQRGWPSVRTALPAVLRQLHYHTDATGLVLIVDSNGSPPHNSEQANDEACRLCQLRRIADQTLTSTTQRTMQPSLRVAIGLAVPAIEAWLLCGVDPHVTEAAWINGLKEGRGNMPYTKGDLKRQLYGTSHPSLALETEKMTEAAAHLAADLSGLTRLFQHGFGALFNDLRAWRQDIQSDAS